MKVLALVDKVLVPQVLALALREKSWPWKAKTLPQDPGHVVAVRVCSAHTHGVT